MEIIGYALRILILYILTYFAARILPGKALAQMTAYELVGLLLITTVAAEPLVTKVTGKALVGIVLLVFLTFLTSRLALINKMTSLLEHAPTILISKGNIDYKALKKSFLSLNEFLGLLRAKGFDKVSEIEYAILEPQGQLSVFPCAQARPVQNADLGLSPKESGITIPLIMDGEMMTRNLAHAGIDQDWLLKELQCKGIKDYQKEVLLAEIDSLKKLSIYTK